MSDSMPIQSKTLKKNNITKFILKIDLLPESVESFEQGLDSIAQFFDRKEKRILEGFSIDINNGNPTLSKTNDYEYVLVSDSKMISMTFSKLQSAFWFETSNYIDNTKYEDIFKRLHEILQKISTSMKSKRIGMRFINEFPCNEIGNIKKVLRTEDAKVIIELLKDKNLTRALAYKEFNKDGRKARIQYGVANKFYPSVITRYDLILDIDVYYDLQMQIDSWDSIIAELNHAAYDYFTFAINSKYLEAMR